MQDIKSDFYKRFSNKSDTAQKRSTPGAICLFGGLKDCTYQAGLALSFGSHTAFRKRSDGRIILSRTDSDSVQSVNIAELDRFHGAGWAMEILFAAMRLPTDFGGFEMLIHSDCGLPSLSPHILSSLMAVTDMYGSVSPLTTLDAAKAPPYYLPSLADAKVGIVNEQTGKAFIYSPTLSGAKIVVVIAEKAAGKIPFSKTFAAREDKRTIVAASRLAKGDLISLASLISESSEDLLILFDSSKHELLYRLAKDYTNAIKLLPDRSGAVCFVKDALVDEFVQMVGDRYEKKAGSRPAFYISD